MTGLFLPYYSLDKIGYLPSSHWGVDPTAREGSAIAWSNRMKLELLLLASPSLGGTIPCFRITDMLVLHKLYWSSVVKGQSQREMEKNEKNENVAIDESCIIRRLGNRSTVTRQKSRAEFRANQSTGVGGCWTWRCLGHYDGGVLFLVWYVTLSSRVRV